MRRKIIRFAAIFFFVAISVPVCVLTYSGAYILFYLFKFYHLLKPNKMNLTKEERQRLIDELNNQNK